MTTDDGARWAASTTIDAKTRRSAPHGVEYQGTWVGPEDGVPHPCLCEEVKLDALDAGARDQAAKQIVARAKRLAERDWRHVVPPLLVETAAGDARVISLVQGRRLADSVNDHGGHPDARTRLADWFEQLLSGLAELHAADLTLGPFELPDVLASGGDAGAPETLRWLRAATLPVEIWTGGTALRRDERPLSDACQNDASYQTLSAKQQDLRRLGLLICCLAGGRQAIADADPQQQTKTIRGRRLRGFVRDLLENEDEGSQPPWLSQAGGLVAGLATSRGAASHVDATGALQDWRRVSSSQKSWWMLALLALILLAALTTWGWVGSQSANELNRQLTSMIQQRDKALVDLDGTQRDLEQCKRESGQSPPPIGPVDVGLVERDAAVLLNRLLIDESLDREALLLKAESELAGSATRSEQLGKIREWLGAFEGTKTYRIDLSSLQGKYDDYLLSISVGDEWQVWEMELQADDDFETPPSFEISWKAGQSIGVLLEEDGYTYNSNLIVKPFAGPMALWLLHKSLQHLQERDGDTILVGEVVDCPGPPLEWAKPLSSSDLP